MDEIFVNIAMDKATADALDRIVEKNTLPGSRPNRSATIRLLILKEHKRAFPSITVEEAQAANNDR